MSVRTQAILFLILIYIPISERPHAYAIVITPSSSQVQAAIQKGQSAVRSQTPPSQLYWRFGPSGSLKPHGLIMTKLGGVAVLSAHYAFRSAVPSSQDLARVTKESDLQLSVTVFGAFPEFAVDSYILLKQGTHLIKPARVRSDARAHRSEVWPDDPPFQAKIVAFFSYGTFDPLASTTVFVFPGEGGEVRFELDFSKIP
ncbi:MAG: hypothetical protein MRJ96_15515 [Nitrospirales bacterium]|nr:hypothetical protein [Nitrospira sp.]MDR4502852.1 hypothetical protein [Nitrospirales bacterium]